ncbi:MAG TPA: hypothetical protein VNE59_12305 [Burkholderiales bacterium]|nr:hypothetical protein [Burkholderiales bacterium]
MDPAPATDEVIDLIAGIEMHRQEAAKELDPVAACHEALRKLHELLERERNALQSHVPGSGHAANIEALTADIARVKQLAGETSQPAGSGNPRPARHQLSLRAGARRFPRSRGRRTMGRGER